MDEIPPSMGLEPSSDSRINYPQQGATSDVAFVSDGSREIVVKRCNSPIYLPWLRREHDVLRWLANTNSRLPKALSYVEQDSPSGPEAWLAMSRVPGRPFGDLLAEQTPDGRIELFRSFGNAVRTLHDNSVPTPLSGQEPWLSRILKQAEKNLAWCDGNAGLLEKLIRTKPDPVSETLMHGDLALDNVLVDESGIVGIIDWSSGDVGDPRYDLAIALHSDDDFDITQTEIAAFYSTYGGAPLDGHTQDWFMNLWEFF